MPERFGRKEDSMKIRFLGRAQRVCRACRLRKTALRLYIALHAAEDGY